jgi:hypothetical protein
MSQPTLDETDALSAPAGMRPGTRSVTRPGPRATGSDSAPDAARGQADGALTLPEGRAAEARTPSARPADGQASADPRRTPAADSAPTSDRPAPASGGQALVVIENGVVKYADAGVFVADLSTLTTDQDPDRLYATLKSLRDVQPSDARARLVDRVHEGLRGALSL